MAHTNIATIPVSSVPGESAVTPDGGRLFVVHQVGLTMATAPSTSLIRQPIWSSPLSLIPGNWAKDILFTPDGRFAYIANFSNGEVDVIDTTTYQVTNIPTAGWLPSSLHLSRG